MSKFKTTSFWLGLSGAIVIVLDTLSSIIGFNLYSKEIETIVMAICSALVMLGIVTKKNDTDTANSSQKELLEEINKDNK